MRLVTTLILLLFSTFQNIYLEASVCQRAMSLGNNIMYFSGIRSELEKPWEFDEETEAKLSSFMDAELDLTLSDDELLMKAYQLSIEIFKAKLKQQHTVVKIMMRRVLSSAEGKGVFANTIGKLFERLGPTYHPIFNRILGVQNSDNGFDMAISSIHELTHAIDRNQNPFICFSMLKIMLFELVTITPMPFNAALTYRIEGPSIGSQWELARRIPMSIRVKIAKIIKSNSPEGGELSRMDVVSFKSLFYARLSKEEFIKKLRPYHGYTFRQNWERSKYALLSFSIKPVLFLVSSVSFLNHLSSSNLNPNPHELFMTEQRFLLYFLDKFM